ncbi:hypothetical protein V5O48_015041 [Marasmius crinis-equi]|uniref:Uncharacterized protein n=1 Tax=Marasmius crinis-equi TaxID=585013 RepID=A0ABR3EVY1_9AGAR
MGTLQAYNAYGDGDFLEFAQDEWNRGLPAVLKDSDISAQNASDRNLILASASACKVLLMLTKPQKDNKTVGVTSSATSPTYPYNTGSAIHALSLVASLTLNASAMLLLHDIIAGATSFGAWHDRLGILSVVDNGESRAHIIRGYTVLYKGTNIPSDLKSYLKSYISNQACYNAVTQISLEAGRNIYGPTWDVPTIAEFNPQAQAAAISALLGGTALESDESSDSGQALASAAKGTVAGGVVGGVLAIGLIIGGVWFYLWKRRQERKSFASKMAASPFHLPPVSGRFKEPDGLEKNHRLNPSHGTIHNGSEVTHNALPATTQTVEVTVQDLVLAVNRRLQREQMRNGGGWESQERPPQYPGNEQIGRV